MGRLACNCSLIYSSNTREAIVIDPGNDAESFLTLVSQKKLKVIMLLHTHAHLIILVAQTTSKKKLGCPILLHQQDLFLYKVFSNKV